MINHKNVNEEILLILLNDSDPNVRCFAAMNEKISLFKLKELVNSNDIYIREGIAFNTNSDEEILEKLYKQFPEIVLKHYKCPNYLKVLSK